MPVEEVTNIDVDPETEERMAAWLSDSILKVESARASLEDIWLDIEEIYEMTELEEKKNFPFEGAAHLMIQLIPMFCETMKAKVFNTIFAPQDPFSAVLRRKGFEPFVKPLRRFMTWATENELNLQEVLDPMILELYKLGTIVGKVVYEKKTRTRHVWNRALEEWEEKVEVVKDHPEFVHPQLADFFFPLHIHRLDDAEWLAERFPVGLNEFQRWKNTGSYKNLDEVESWIERQQTRFEERREPIDRAIDLAEYRFHEVWFEFQLKEGQDPVPLTGYLHVPSRTFVKLSYNWFPLGLHPYEIATHETRTHKVYGAGVGQVALPFQKEVSTMHNQRLDAQTLANSNVFKRKSSSTVPEDLVWRAGGTIPVDEMDDIEPLFTGQRFDSTLQEEQHTIQLLKERIGLQDFSPEQIGSAQSTTTLAILGERTRRFDSTIQTVRRFLSSLMMKALLLYQKYYPEGKPIIVMGEEGVLVEQIIKFPQEWIRHGIGIEVTATTSATSKELDRQNKLSLFGLITQTYGQVTQYLLQAANPQIPGQVRQVLLRLVDGLLTYLQDVLEDFNLNNARELTSAIEALKGQVAQQEGLAQRQGVGAPQGLEGVQSPPGGVGSGATTPTQ